MDEYLTILVVDDDELDRLAVRRSLGAVAFAATLHEAATAEGALAALEGGLPDCVLLDYRLPDRDGLDLLLEIRRRGLTTPVIMLTGQGDEQLVVSLMKAGASDYLSKGALTGEQLAQRIRNAVRVQRAEAYAQSAERALQASAERLRLLAEASELLSASLDTSALTTSLVRLVTAATADWAAIDLLTAEGELARAAAGPAPDDAQPGEGGAQALGCDTAGLPVAVLRAGQAQIWPRPLGAPEAETPDWLRHRAAGVASVLCVPLPARERVLGTLTLVRLRPRPVFSAEDLSLARDLGRRAAMAFDNAALYDEARSAIQIRDVFLSVASHELKTPLASLYGNVQLLERRMLREGTLSERDRRVLRVVIEQSQRLDKMVTALLDTSRLQAGQLSVERLPLDLVALIRQLAEEVRPSLDQHQLALELVDKAYVLGDAVRLHQVFQNLMHNAVKYSPAGGRITIQMSVDGQAVRVAISDEGIGIPKEALPRLFRRYYRAENAQQSQIGGIGLGLYVVYEIVHLHGGSVEVASVEGQGSTFTVLLPLANAQNHAMLAADMDALRPA
jgi:signal transduction histidine kinase/FixJ family two-component response regulator